MTAGRAAKAIIVPLSAVDITQTPRQLSLVFPDGTAVSSVKKAAAQADSTATDVAGLKADFNALLAKLRTANILS